MSIVKNTNIGMKLAVCFGIVTVLVVGMVANQKINNATILAATRTVQNEQIILDGIVGAQIALTEMNAVETRLHHTTSPQEIQTLIEEAKASSQRAWDGLETPISIAKKPDVLEDIRTSLQAVAADLERQGAVRRDATVDTPVSDDQSAAVTAAKTAIDASLTNAHRFTDEAKAKLLETLRLNDIVGLVAGLGIVLVMVASAFILRALISRPIRVLASAMRQLAAGDTGAAIPFAERRDEIGEMAQAVATLREGALTRQRLESEAAQAQGDRNRQLAIDNAKAEDLKVFVHHVETGFDQLAAGDLTARMNQAVAPEFEPIRAKFNSSVQSLETTIGSVVGAVGSIRSGLGQINVASMDLSRRTEQQAASLEETVAALDEVMRGVNIAADSAGKAEGATTTALANAEKGGEIVGQAIEAMSQIKSSSDKISQIIGVIDEIAFQTNLLALNAGVEAARAGDAGRGFAVVASEVRSLAQRSAEAAKEIKALISTSSSQVSQGVELVSASGKSLADIVTQVGQMNLVVREIARNASDQATSLKEVAIAANQMDKVTQQNAAMVEETTAAAQSLSTETQQLADLTSQFRTRAGQSQSVATASRDRHAPASPGPVVQMRATGTGGAARKPAPAEEGWEEF